MPPHSPELSTTVSAAERPRDENETVTLADNAPRSGSPEAAALRVALAYALVAALWIGFSDTVLRDVLSERALIGSGRR